MADVTITREDNPAKGRYVAKVAGIDGEGELTYSRVNPHLIIADHTGVPDPSAAWGGAGTGAAAGGRRARQGVKIIPLCPYVNAERRKAS
jgi:predicted GNAT family acetyltransferase